MKLTLFRGSDDGFTFVGVLILLFVMLLLVPAVGALMQEKLEKDIRVLKERQELFIERQTQIESSGGAGGGL